MIPMMMNPSSIILFSLTQTGGNILINEATTDQNGIYLFNLTASVDALPNVIRVTIF